MIKIRVAFIDGSFAEEEYPDHEIEEVELMIEGTPKDLLCRVEVEDRKDSLIYTYTRKQTYVY